MPEAVVEEVVMRNRPTLGAEAELSHLNFLMTFILIIFNRELF